MACASDPGVELLLTLRLLRSVALVVNLAPVVAGQSTQFALHVGPAVALQDVPSALGQDYKSAVFADGGNRLDQPLFFQVSQVAAIRVERAVLTVAEIAGGHDAEGADGSEGANLRAAQPDVAVSRPDTLAVWTTGQIDVAREDVSRFEPLAIARVAQPTATASAEFATVIVAVARSSVQRGSKSIETSFEEHARAELAGGAGRGRPARRAGATPVTSAVGAEDGWGCPATGPASLSSALGDAIRVVESRRE